MPCFSVSIVNFEHVIAGWDVYMSNYLYLDNKKFISTYDKD